MKKKDQSKPAATEEPKSPTDPADDVTEETEATAAEEEAETGAEETAADDAATTEEEEEEEEGAEQVIRLTQTQLNDIIQKKTKRLRTNLEAQVESAKKQVESLQAELASYRTAEIAKATAQFNALPEAVRDLCPVKLENLAKSGTAFKRFTEFLEKAVKLGNPPNSATKEPAKESPKPKPGNPPDPAPTSRRNATEAEGAQRLPSFWQSL